MSTAPEITEIDASVAADARYDLGIWAAGYESRSAWLVQSSFKPRNVQRWLKVEFADHRDVHSGAASRSIEFGEMLGGQPGKQHHDGHWMPIWAETIDAAFAAAARPIDLFVDYSSMPRTIYGPLLVQAFRYQAEKIRSITLCYVPGQHGANVDGSRGVKSLRAVIGIEGRASHGRAAFVLGLGYDGVLAEAVLELFQVSQFSCLIGRPGVLPTSVDRVLDANRSILSRAERIASAPAWSIERAVEQTLALTNWYLASRDVLLVPLGPKPHVVGGIIAALVDPRIGFRLPQTCAIQPVEVTVAADTVPFFSRVQLH